MSQEIKIAMLGATGVGKTSLLTAMYDQFENTIGQTNLQLIPDLKSNAILQEKLGELKSLVESQDEDNEFEATGGIKANTGAVNSFIFDLGKKGGKPSIRLKFQDYSGENLNANALISDLEKVQNLINESVIILIAIDAPALMEAKGQYNHLINRPQQIKNILAKAFQELKEPRLVILAPIKCETYLQNEKSTRELLRRVKDEYANLLGFLSSELLLPWVVTVVTPVQTVGTVVFSHIDVIKEGGRKYPRFKFHKNYIHAKYRPKDCEQPFRYILRFLLKQEINRLNYHWGPFSFIRSWFNLDREIKEAAQNVVKGCKTDPQDGFAILQGKQYL
jgi:GTPase SAR1 family protein